MDFINRVSVGIKLPESYRLLLATYQNELRRKGGDSNLRPASAADFAIFACQLGEMSLSDMAKVETALRLAVASVSSFQVMVGSAVGEPNLTQPKSVFLNLTGGEALDHIAKSLLMQGVTKPDTFSGYLARLDVCRLKALDENARVGLGRAVRMATVPQFPPVQIDRIDLMVATAESSGPGLKVVESCPLQVRPM